MDLSKINAAAKPGAGLLPLMKLDDLKPNLYYQITNIYKAKTKFGESIMVNMEGTHAGFLPPRMFKYFEANPEELEVMQNYSKKGQLLMVNVHDNTGPNYVQFAIGDPIPPEMAIEVTVDEKKPKKPKGLISDYVKTNL